MIEKKEFILSYTLLFSHVLNTVLKISFHWPVDVIGALLAGSVVSIGMNYPYMFCE
jgi:hypothetical protein